MKRRINPASLHWTNKPGMSVIRGDKLIVETEPYTSLNSLTYGSRDAASLELDPMAGFTMTLKISYDFRAPEDECGIILKENSAHWCKCCVICREGSQTDIACTEYEGGYGDRSSREIGAVIDHIYFQVRYWNGNVRFRYSFNGDRFSDFRWLHFTSEGQKVTAGIYACSPGNSWFDCTFSEMELIDDDM